MIILPTHDEKIMPITLGSPLRVPSEDWENWGIKWDRKDEFNWLVEKGREEYEKEWARGDPSQIEIVAEASRKAFGGKDNNQLLREKIGEVVAKHLEMKSYDGKRVFYVLDIGAGAGDSFEAFLKKLPKDFKGEIHAVLLDPAEKPLQKAAERVGTYGLKYTLLKGRQDQIPELFAICLGDKKMSAVMQVGAIHHDPQIPFEYFFDITEDGGIFASGDWHPQVWQHPAYVLAMLETNWPEYKEAINHFKKVYGVKESKLPEDPADRKACEDIFRFWKAYYSGLKERGKDYGSNSIWPLEAHQDYRRYLRKIKKAEFSTKINGYLKELLQETNTGNPHQFYPNSTIIMGTFGYKLK
ncbi:MAG: class I SAM-dependent methyltransferase [Candidatus Aenigmatarchaeota archaeon]